jgi:hypothetical protein
LAAWQSPFELKYLAKQEIASAQTASQRHLYGSEMKHITPEVKIVSLFSFYWIPVGGFIGENARGRSRVSGIQSLALDPGQCPKCHLAGDGILI